MGRFQITMRSSRHLNRLFGRTLAYSIVTRCGGQTNSIAVKLVVDQKGCMRIAR